MSTARKKQPIPLSQEPVVLHIRIPAELKRAVQRLAEQSDRTMSQQVTHMLKRQIEAAK